MPAQQGIGGFVGNLARKALQNQTFKDILRVAAPLALAYPAGELAASAFGSRSQPAARALTYRTLAGLASGQLGNILNRPAIERQEMGQLFGSRPELFAPVGPGETPSYSVGGQGFKFTGPRTAAEVAPGVFGPRREEIEPTPDVREAFQRIGRLSPTVRGGEVSVPPMTGPPLPQESIQVPSTVGVTRPHPFGGMPLAQAMDLQKFQAGQKELERKARAPTKLGARERLIGEGGKVIVGAEPPVPRPLSPREQAFSQLTPAEQRQTILRPPVARPLSPREAAFSRLTPEEQREVLLRPNILETYLKQADLRRLDAEYDDIRQRLMSDYEEIIARYPGLMEGTTSPREVPDEVISSEGKLDPEAERQRLGGYLDQLRSNRQERGALIPSPSGGTIGVPLAAPLAEPAGPPVGGREWRVKTPGPMFGAVITEGALQEMLDKGLITPDMEIEEVR